MMSSKKKILAGAIALALSFGGYLPAAGTAEQGVSLGSLSVASAAEQKDEQMKISINLAARSLALYRGNTRVALYPIGPGKPYTPTPTGYYKIQDKEVNPTWTSPEDPSVSISSGPDCPIGYRWMTIQGNYGIHGTNHPESIGHYVSNGCIRMYNEDVEKLFDNVSVGTPVEITYNRVVVEKAPDDQIVYYIYPDGYGRQDLDVDSVRTWLKGYGVQNFVSDEAITQKIEASDGEPTYIAKVYPLFVNGQKLQSKAVVQEGKTYLPAIELAKEVKVNLGWDARKEQLISDYGSAHGYLKQDTYYCEPKEAETLFHLQGTLAQDGTFTMTNGAPVAQATAEPEVKPLVEQPSANTAAQTQSAAGEAAQQPTAAAQSAKTDAAAGQTQVKHEKTLQEIEAEATKKG